MRTHHRSGRRGPCLDLAHRFPDMTCTRCAPSHGDRDDAVETIRHRHARVVAEDRDGFGWPS